MSAELAETVSPTSRFQIVSKPYALPGKCACCGAVDRPCVDFGFDVDYYGTIYLCVTCITEAASLVGMVDGAELKQARLVQRDTMDQLEKAGEVVNEYVERLNRLHTDFLASLTGTSGPASDVDSTDSEGNAGTSEPDESETTEGISDASGQDNRPPVNKRSSRVSKRTGDGSDTGVFEF